MSQIVLRANISSAEFPFVSDIFGRTVIVKNLDFTTPGPTFFSGTQESVELGVPQLLYCHNVMPTDTGFQSIDFSPEIEAAVDHENSFDLCYTLRDADENIFLFSPARGNNWIYKANNGRWVQASPISSWNGRYVTRSYINGRTFVCYEKFGFFEYDPTTDQMNALTFTGLTVGDVLGICSSNNYNLAYTKDTIFWSSLVDETDFVASLSTGAGSAIPQDIKGEIVTILPISGGILVYTTKNVIAGFYTNNARFPFSFKEISNGGGLANPEHATFETALGTHYAWTTAGFQKLTTTSAETIFPSATDFLAGRIFEDFDTETQQFTIEELTRRIKVKLTFIESRYLIASYGKLTGIYTHALVYDTVLKRWGKLKITHVDCFYFVQPNVFGEKSYEAYTGFTYADWEGTSYAQLSERQNSIPLPKATIGFLQSDGTVVTLNFTNESLATDSVAFFGKYQLTRMSNIGIQQVELENPENTVEIDALTYNTPITCEELGDLTCEQLLGPDGADLTYAQLTRGRLLQGASKSIFFLAVWPSFNGKNYEDVKLLSLIEADTHYQKYSGIINAKNLTFQLQGTFDLRSLIFTFTQHGRVR